MNNTVVVDTWEGEAPAEPTTQAKLAARQEHLPPMNSRLGGSLALPETRESAGVSPSQSPNRLHPGDRSVLDRGSGLRKSGENP